MILHTKRKCVKNLGAYSEFTNAKLLKCSVCGEYIGLLYPTSYGANLFVFPQFRKYTQNIESKLIDIGILKGEK